MKVGDLVRWKDRGVNNSSGVWIWGRGLLVEFNKIQNFCIVLDNNTGKLVKSHCNDVQLIKSE